MKKKMLFKNVFQIEITRLEIVKMYFCSKKKILKVKGLIVLMRALTAKAMAKFLKSTSHNSIKQAKKIKILMLDLKEDPLKIH